ncbi:MAG: nitronate monooxygenase [Anaerolineae bacterium]|nr:nitronate monooxygenase [Anaerolineae bacterium]
MMRTSVCDVLGIQYPIVQAGMARSTSPELVAAVSAAGGLGTLGCLSRSAQEAVADIRRIRALTDRPFSVNFVVHRLDEACFAACLEERAPVFTFFRSDPTLLIKRAHGVGALAMVQITTVAEARQAIAAGADVLIAQGHEAGGHNGPIPLLTLLPQGVTVAEGRPVLAAGGLVDGRGLAAMLCLGADGIVMGTRFLMTTEAPTSEAHRQAILNADDTVASKVFDTLWAVDWPGVTVRTIRNRLVERWAGREADLAREREGVIEGLREAEARQDLDEIIFLAGVGASRIRDVQPAGQIVVDTVAAAQAVLKRLG